MKNTARGQITPQDKKKYLPKGTDGFDFVLAAAPANLEENLSKDTKSILECVINTSVFVELPHLQDDYILENVGNRLYKKLSDALVKKYNL